MCAFSIQKPTFPKNIYVISDYLFVFTYIYPHFRIIPQTRIGYCKKNCVIWI
ncbi:uncharacterized protein LACBIDRAFT_302743 [Laccaria bicolor S238N-H82]|uniref:Predicted protein n=1 Tax=Laccaria bicolor (strain S238N-H82 / ATCC MYA-4686) TaxID=486041 RepID=B0DI68_LACBS|nr:uncharacterized protein LACBIDRAFT_302743 [Laccaria bicolor S238N-H82]EDR05624.1 predicted protein [Laccaria bicolor S238N-H82]|eukprot:XP_001883728.1 predicted protein [Laccaria bicolor S238N-H82]